MKISLVITVLNEAKTIELLLDSIDNQTRKPDEVIITDGGSKDKTVAVIENWLKISRPKVQSSKFIVFTQKGNRSVGRNAAIKKSKFPWIAVTDAGCILDKNWLKELAQVQKKNESDVVAGYYEGKSKSHFEEAVIPYFLVMPERVKAHDFLPASRSMMMRKSVWKTAGGFNEKLSHNEDYDFAHWIRRHRHRYSIAFARKAVVAWLPPESLSKFIKTIYRFAKGDLEAGIVRPKVVSIFARYLVFLLVSSTLPGLSSLLILAYLAWAVVKNWYYVPHGWYWLPILQVSSDLAVMWGSVRGKMKS